jgi:hypothetical protein
MNKKELSERDICTKFITPALRQAGWDEQTQLREEVSFTKGRVIVRGKMVSRGAAKRADYILYYKPNIPLAVIEAKDNHCAVGDGMQQALEYAKTLDLSFVFSSNGDGFVFHDRTASDGPMERNLRLDEFPPPAVLWARYREAKGLPPEADPIVLQDYFDDGSGKAPAVLPGECSECGDRGNCQGTEPAAPGHGDRHRQDVHGVPNHLEAVEGGPEEEGAVPGGPERARGPDDGQRFPSFRRRHGQAEHQLQSHRAAGSAGRVAAHRPRQETAHRHVVFPSYQLRTSAQGISTFRTRDSSPLRNTPFCLADATLVVVTF